MKSFLLLSFFLVGGLTAFCAQPPSVTTGTNETIIEADGGAEYNPPKIVFRRNVHVIDPQMELICEQLTAYIQTNNNKMDLVIAETNVVIFQNENWAIGDKAVYNMTNDIIELTGEVLLDTPRGYFIGDHIIFDRQTGKVSVPGKVRMGGTGALGTNATLLSPFDSRRK